MVNLLAFLGQPQPIQVRHNLGDGPDGPRYGEAVVVAGRWEESSKQIQTPDGRVVTVTGVVYVSAAGNPKPDDQLARGHDATGQDWRRVETVDTPTWFDGSVMHYEVYVS